MSHPSWVQSYIVWLYRESNQFKNIYITLYTGTNVHIKVFSFIPPVGVTGKTKNKQKSMALNILKKNSTSWFRILKYFNLTIVRILEGIKF